MDQLQPGFVMDLFFNGLVSGSLYVAIAIGLTLVFGVLGIINFAHGALYAIGAYATLEAATRLGFWPSLVVSPLLVGLMGMIIESLFLRRLYKEAPELIMLFTFGLSMFIEQSIRMGWGAGMHPFYAPKEIWGPLRVGGFSTSLYGVFVLAVMLLAIFAVWWFLERTPYGRIVRAGSRDPEMVRMLGINLRPIFTLVFGLGAALAGLAGLLAAPISTVEPAMGNAVGLIGFVVLVIGGLGSFWGAIAAGVLVGEVNGFMKALWGPMSDTSVYILLVLVLLLRPRGLFGERWEKFE